MAFDNNVSVVGNLVRDPELRFTPSGQATCSFGLAVNRSWTDKATNERREETSFLDVVCWGQLAENVAQSLTRGSRAVVTGALEQRSWENDSGEKRSKIEIKADEVAPSLKWATVTVVKNERQQGGQAPAQAAQPARAAARSNGGGRQAAPTTADYQYEEEPF